MSAHLLPMNLLRAFNTGMFNVTDPGATVGTISWSGKGLAICHVTTAGAEARALQAATAFNTGVRIQVVLQKNAGALTITGAEASVVLNSNGDFAVFVVSNSNGTKVWKIAEVSGTVTRLSVNRVVNLATTAVGVGTTATLTAAQLKGGYITGNPGGAATYTLDTATNILATIPNPQVGDSFDFTVNNLNGTNAITMAADASGAIDGVSQTVPLNCIRRFTVQVTNVGTPAYLLLSYN